jgi:hypothetical protein
MPNSSVPPFYILTFSFLSSRDVIFGCKIFVVCALVRGKAQRTVLREDRAGEVIKIKEREISEIGQSNKEKIQA